MKADVTEFINGLKEDVYAEPTANEMFIDSGVESIKHLLKEGDTVLDIGCGMGYAMDVFRAHGLKCTGLTLNVDEKLNGIHRGHDVEIMDMHDIEYSNGFDVIWARHCLEHSPIPFYVLKKLYAAMKNTGVIYVEVPAPETPARHETNPNHYSVMGMSMWQNLMVRAGFMDVASYGLSFMMANGNPDVYFRLIGRKYDPSRA